MAATVPTGALFQLHSERIVEVINRNLDVILPSLDPVWRDTVVTSQGVGPADAIGRDMRIIKVFQGSMAGVLEQAFPRNDLVLFGDDTDEWGQKLHTQNLNQTWPDPLDGPNATPYRLAVQMRAMMANIMFTMGELQAEALPATIGEIVAPKLEGFARNIAHTYCNYWYLAQNTDYRLCIATNVSDSSTWVDDTAGDGGYYLEFEPDNQATDRFYVGQRIDLIESTEDYRINDSAADTAQTLSTRQPVFVSKVDELTNTIRMVSTTDPTGWTGTPATLPANVRVVYANSWLPGAGADPGTAATGVAGMNSWLKMGSGSDDNFLLGNDRITGDEIDVTIHPEHKSFSQDLNGAVLTEHKLRQYLRRFHSAKNKYGYYIDCLIASDGVWLGYESTKIGREMIDRTGRLSSLRNEGTDNDEYGGFHFSFDGRSYMGYTSCYVESGAVYGIRKGGQNWKRYVPPDPRGSRNFDRTEPFIPFKFVAGILTGLGTNQLPIYDTSGNNNLVTEGTQMPGMIRMQLVPDQPCGMKLHDVGEDRIYSDETNN